ncbi:hypothetical protein, partial [uncultured Clostridium sp.]|uniref:hypothetical protein n=1 Tax=uncultured Clostridium sp. TaxID=59620 RepID=UPI0026308B80
MPDQKIHSTKQFMYLQLFDQPINLYYLIPRFFTISTRNASYGFNVEMLKDTSSVISNLIDNDAQQKHYFFDIEDDENIVGKFEQLYLGKNVVFNESDLPIACFITKELNITNIPYFLKQDVQRLQYYRITKPNAIQLSRMSFEDFLKQKIPKSFLIITNNKEYKCNKYGVYSSKIIYKAIMNDPTTSQFVYDFDNEFNEFQQICDFFNFESVQITSINMNSLKRIAEDLNIECIVNDINNFIHSYENSTKTIDAKHEIIDDL